MYNAVNDNYLISGYWDKDNIESKRKSTLEKVYVGTLTNNAPCIFNVMGNLQQTSRSAVPRSVKLLRLRK